MDPPESFENQLRSMPPAAAIGTTNRADTIGPASPDRRSPVGLASTFDGCRRGFAVHVGVRFCSWPLDRWSVARHDRSCQRPN